MPAHRQSQAGLHREQVMSPADRPPEARGKERPEPDGRACGRAQPPL